MMDHKRNKINYKSLFEIVCLLITTMAAIFNIFDLHIPINIEFPLIEIKSKALDEIHIESAENIIKDKKEYILQKKNEYADSDTICINGNYVNFIVSEIAARVNLVNDGKIINCYNGAGIKIPDATIAILDYETDDIVQKLITDNNGEAEYHPSTLGQKIYYVASAPDYNIEVSEPIVFENDQSELNCLPVTLSKPDDKFTSDFKIDVNTYKGNAIINGKLFLKYSLKKSKDKIKLLEEFLDHHNAIYSYSTDDTGCVVSNDNYCFFELNTRYLINVWLIMDDDYRSVSAIYDDYRTIDGSTTNTNSLTVQFDYIGKQQTLLE